MSSGNPHSRTYHNISCNGIIIICTSFGKHQTAIFIITRNPGSDVDTTLQYIPFDLLCRWKCPPCMPQEIQSIRVKNLWHYNWKFVDRQEFIFCILEHVYCSSQKYDIIINRLKLMRASPRMMVRAICSAHPPHRHSISINYTYLPFSGHRSF